MEFPVFYKKLNKYIFLGYAQNLRQLFQQRFFIPLSVSILFYGFWISYPNYSFRNFFPILIIFVPLSLYFITKMIPFSRIVLIAICCSLLFKTVFQNTNGFIVSVLGAGVKRTGSQLEGEYKKKTLIVKAFISYLELNYGNQIKNLKKWIYMSNPYDRIMSDPTRGYVKNSYITDHWRFMEEPERYGMVALVRKKISSIPYNELVYKYLKESDSFVEKPSPFPKKFVLFIHRDVLALY